MSVERDEAARPAANLSRFQSVAPIVIFDVGGPLAVYYGLVAAGLSTLTALILSGVLPVVGIALTAVRRRRLDAIGILVLVGIVVGTILGLISRSAHLVLLDGVVPTAVFGIVCVGSVWSARPMIFRFALESMGADTAKGRAFADRWRYPGFRRSFRVTTVVWGVAFIAEAAAQLIIVENCSAGVAKTTSNLMPLAVIAVVIAWNVAYAKRGQRQGEEADKARRARGEAPPAMPS
jgi:intracellular septation protein A